MSIISSKEQSIISDELEGIRPNVIFDSNEPHFIDIDYTANPSVKPWTTETKWNTRINHLDVEKGQVNTCFRINWMFSGFALTTSPRSDAERDSLKWTSFRSILSVVSSVSAIFTFNDARDILKFDSGLRRSKNIMFFASEILNYVPLWYIWHAFNTLWNPYHVQPRTYLFCSLE